MELQSPDQFQNPNPSLNFYTNYSLDPLDYVLEELLSNCHASLGDVGASQFSYSSSSPVATSSLDEVSREDPDPLLDAVLLVDGGATSSANPNNMNLMRNAVRKAKGDGAEKRQRVAFKTKSKLDVLVDGYRWRKYGKKEIKNNPNLRNYYKCTSEGCQVKKIIERWIEDPSYVITQYVGVHTHTL